MVIDVFSYNGELDLLKLRLNILSPFVDKFIVVEAKTTFCGDSKLLHFSKQEQLFKQWWNKLDYYVVDENYSKEEIEEATLSPYTNADPRWIREFLQKEALQKALIHNNVKDDDIVYIGDVDEIWTPTIPTTPKKLKLRVYTYYLNNLSTEEFWGTIVTFYKDIKGKCLNNIRNDISLRTHEYHGWHFTNQGGIMAVDKKLVDQYNNETFNPVVRGLLTQRFGIKDFIGRNFTFIVDESHWPHYLKEHRREYKHLLKSL